MERIATQMKLGHEIFEREDGTMEIVEPYVEEEEEEESGERERQREEEARRQNRKMVERMEEMRVKSVDAILRDMSDSELRDRLAAVLAGPHTVDALLPSLCCCCCVCVCVLSTHLAVLCELFLTNLSLLSLGTHLQPLRLRESDRSCGR